MVGRDLASPTVAFLSREVRVWCGWWLFSGWFGEPPLGVFVAHVHKALVAVAGCPRFACVLFFFLSGCLYAGFPLLFLFFHLFLSWKSTSVFGCDVRYPVVVCEDNFDEIVRLRCWHSRNYWLGTRLYLVQEDSQST